MIKYFRFFITFLLAVIALGAQAQSTATTSSPYSRYGLGELNPALLPQNVGMGGIGTAISSISGYNNINPLNPASYGAIRFTVIDAGMYSNISNYAQTGQTSQTDANFRLSHVTFAIPTSKHSALSFGLLPYSAVGYNYTTTKTGFGTSATPSGPKVDTNATNYVYRGEGGLSKAYLGWGFGIGKHLLLGANVSYIFGNLTNYQDLEIPGLVGFDNTEVETRNSIRGLNYDYGIQYTFDLSDTKHLTLGYSGSAGTSLNSAYSYIVSQFTYDANGVANVATDTLKNEQNPKSKIKLPQINHFGISFQSDLKFLIGADYSIGNWSNLTFGGVNQGLQNSKTLNVGGQFTPNANALNNYFARTDYRLGFIYEDTYYNVNNTGIKSKAITFGFGFPLAPNNQTAFYKINFSAELGQTGTVQNGLVRENYINLHLGFTLNDKWFIRYKFE